MHALVKMKHIETLLLLDYYELEWLIMCCYAYVVILNVKHGGLNEKQTTKHLRLFGF